ncbi:hypothetical protein BDZ94DRAFT_337662 [Collybia nuda]|uniref:Uncharacterized protein n=1 Tax=Collybia nuda TaxID=64659 RepID=A0A9P5XT94_9AGAR|nr:hypothetical protein BDZ94DRAFT_337662 [Collybia nuda]
MTMWSYVDNEKIDEVKNIRIHREVTTQYFSPNPLGKECVLATFEYRGTCRTYLLRNFAALIADECHISDCDLVSLLSVGHAVLQNIKTMQQIFIEEGYTRIKRSYFLLPGSPP